MADKDIHVKITADAGKANREIKSVGDSFEDVSKKTAKALQSIDRSLNVLKTEAVGKYFADLIMKIGDIGISSIKAANQMRQYEIAFSTMLKSADKGKAILQDLQRFAAETPFDVPGVVQSAQQLMAFGFAAEEIIPTLRILGDTAAGLGKSSAGVQQIAYALGQIRTSGTLKTQDVNQLTNAGINAWEALAQASGKSIREIKEATEKGMIDSAKAIEVITASMADNFGGMMEQTSKEVQGYWNNIVESIGTAQATIGAFAIEGGNLKEALQGVSESVSDMSNGLLEAKNAGKSFGEAIKEAVPPEVVIAVGALASVIGAGLVAALVAATGALAGFLGLSGTVVAAVAGIGATVAGAVTYWDELKGAVQVFLNTPISNLIPAMEEYIDSVKAAKTAHQELNDVADFKRMQEGAAGNKKQTDLFDNKNDYQTKLKELNEKYRIAATGARELAQANAELREAQNAAAISGTTGAERIQKEYAAQIETIKAAQAVEKELHDAKTANLEAQIAQWEAAKAAGVDGSETKIENLRRQLELEGQIFRARSDAADQQIVNLQAGQAAASGEEQIKILESVEAAYANYAQSIAGNAADAAMAIIDGSKSASQALGELLRNIINNIVRTAAEFAALCGVLMMFGVNPPGPLAAKMMFGTGVKEGTYKEGSRGAKWAGLATGGYVAGPGTSTSDSIPAMLSNGEYVVNSAAVRKIGLPALNAINSGRGYADGGLVGAVPVAASAGPATNNSVTLHVSALDASSFESFLQGGGLDKIKQALFDDNRNFASAAGVW